MNAINDSKTCSLCCTKLEQFGVVIGGRRLLDNINLHLHCGELTTVIGPNGAGKTTLLKAILGEIPHTGSLTYLDAKGSRTGNPWIGYVPQKINLDKDSPASVFDFCASCIANFPVWLGGTHRIRQRVTENLKRVQATHLIGRRISTLSGGELQRVLLACAMDPVPNLLLLDEPVSGVDPRGMNLFYEMISTLRQRFDLSIILVSHDLAMVSRYADRLVLLNKTVLASGEPREVLQNEQALRIFGEAISTCQWPPIEATKPLHHPGRA
ncbi:MAG: metal ABC transporter ATP-binding protein [Chitinophagales bacterium]